MRALMICLTAPPGDNADNSSSSFAPGTGMSDALPSMAVMGHARSGLSGTYRQGGSKSSSASTASPTPSSRKPSLLQASSPSSAPPLNSPLSASSVSYSCSLEGAMSPTVGSAGSQGRSSGSHEGQSKGANDARKLLSTEVLEARREKKVGDRHV